MSSCPPAQHAISWHALEIMFSFLPGKSQDDRKQGTHAHTEKEALSVAVTKGKELDVQLLL